MDRARRSVARAWHRAAWITALAAWALLPLVWVLSGGGLLATAMASLAAASWTALVRQRAHCHERIASLQSQLELRHAQLATMDSLAREITASHDPLRLCGALERECRKLLRADLFYVCTIEPEHGGLEVLYAVRRDGLRETERRPLRSALAAACLAARRPLRLSADAEGPLEPFDADRPGTRARAWLAAPLLVEHEPVGLIAAGRMDGGAYTPDEAQWLATLGQQVALALENARHYMLATVDALTGLHLRPYFFRRLEEEYQRARRYHGRFAVLMLDLDEFKRINDSHGHLCGDRYLRALGALVRSGLRAADIACRYGGDEFCLLLPETDLRGAQRIAERLRREVASLVVEVDGLVLKTTASLGLAVYPEHAGEDLRSLLLRADAALYRAKQLGRDRVATFDAAAAGSAARARLPAENLLHGAAGAPEETLR